jgi:hypothetical protein
MRACSCAYLCVHLRNSLSLSLFLSLSFCTRKTGNMRAPRGRVYAPREARVRAGRVASSQEWDSDGEPARRPRVVLCLEDRGPARAEVRLGFANEISRCRPAPAPILPSCDPQPPSQPAPV